MNFNKSAEVLVLPIQRVPKKFKGHKIQFALLFLFNVLLFSYFFILPLNACSSPHPAQNILSTWKKHCPHPLCGRLYEVEKQNLIGGVQTQREFPSHCDEVTETLQKFQNSSRLGTILLLGEIHDNPEHHKFRATFVQPPVVVMEQFTLDQQPALDAFYKKMKDIAPDERPEAFRKALEWENSPWSKYDYAQLFEALLRTQSSIRAGDPPFVSIRKTSKYGSAALTTQDLERLGLNELLETTVMDELRAEIKDSHCGMLPDTYIGNIAFAQRYRDAILADVTVQAVNTYGSAIVIAGNAHVRRDRGIPWYLKRRLKRDNFISILLMETEEGKDSPEDYYLRASDQSIVADFVVFTPKAQREDPCNDFVKGKDLGK